MGRMFNDPFRSSDGNPLVYLVIVLALGMLCLSVCPNMIGLHKTAAEDNARQWAKDVDLPLERAVCNARDTDGDGYVSCTFHVGDDIRTYECNGWTLVMPSEGCREPKIKVNVRSSK